MKRIKGTFKHRLGNIISGFASIIDGIILIASLGSYAPHIEFKWSIYRLKSGKFYDRG